MKTKRLRYNQLSVFIKPSIKPEIKPDFMITWFEDETKQESVVKDESEESGKRKEIEETDDMKRKKIQKTEDDDSYLEELWRIKKPLLSGKIETQAIETQTDEPEKKTEVKEIQTKKDEPKEIETQTDEPEKKLQEIEDILNVVSFPLKKIELPIFKTSDKLTKLLEEEEKGKAPVPEEYPKGLEKIENKLPTSEDVPPVPTNLLPPLPLSLPPLPTSVDVPPALTDLLPPLPTSEDMPPVNVIVETVLAEPTIQVNIFSEALKKLKKVQPPEENKKIIDLGPLQAFADKIAKRRKGFEEEEQKEEEWV